MGAKVAVGFIRKAESGLNQRPESTCPLLIQYLMSKRRAEAR